MSHEQVEAKDLPCEIVAEPLLRSSISQGKWERVTLAGLTLHYAPIPFSTEGGVIFHPKPVGLYLGCTEGQLMNSRG